MGQKSEKILVISEPSEEFDNLRSALVEKDWLVDNCEDFGDADEKLADESIDVVVIDLVREDGAALDILAEVRGKYSSSQLPVVVIASVADKLSLMQAQEEDVTDFIWHGASGFDVHARIGAALKLGALQKRLEAMNRVDGVTGLHKKDYIVEILDMEFERSKRYKRPISCLLVDVDAFDELEETHGAELAKKVLKLTSDVLVETLRNVDEVSRFRTSIFLVLMPETSPGNSVIGLGRVRSRLAEVQSSVREILGSGEPDPAWELSLTAGIATYPDDGLNSSADLIMAAETALYEAKRKGRGETVRADFQ